MSKHTPGPWVYEPELDVPGHRDCAAVNTGKGRLVSEWVYKAGHGEFEQTLILAAAAPDLLEALEDMYSELGDCRLTERAKAAIEKATKKFPFRSVTD